MITSSPPGETLAAAHPLAGKVALVTGSSRRIGAAIVDTLHGAGMSVIIHYCRSFEAAQSLAGRLNGRRPDSARILGADLLDPVPTLERLIDAAADWHDRLDLLVNNASSFYPSPVGQIGEAEWTDLMGTNLKAPLFLTQAAAPWLREAGGSVVNIADIHASHPLPSHPVYCAAKAGLLVLTRALARALAPEVRVNAVSPGPILWPEGDEAPGADRQEVLRHTPLERPGEPGDIAAAVLYLTRDAPYVTGQNLSVDGGRSLV